jgi:predicted dehydrogenase
MENLNIVIVGCGGMSETWVKAALGLPDVRVVGFVDVVEAAARKRRDQFGLSDAVTGTDLAEVLKRTQANVVFDVAIPEVHYDVTMTALAHGCHVLGEKPLANSMAEARTMVKAAREANRVFAVMQNRQHHPTMRRLRRLVQSDQLGQLTTVNIDFYVGAHFGGFRDHMKHVLLLDMAIHTFDQSRFITGADPVAVAYAKEWNPAGSWYDHDASAIAIYEMSNGLIVNYRGSWCAEGLRTSWESEWRLVGTRGSAKWDGANSVAVELVDKSGGFFSEVVQSDLPTLADAGKTEGHRSLIADFVHCLHTGQQPETHGEDNIKSLAMVFGAIECAETGNRVALEPLWETPPADLLKKS